MPRGASAARNVARNAQKAFNPPVASGTIKEAIAKTRASETPLIDGPPKPPARLKYAKWQAPAFALAMVTTGIIAFYGGQLVVGASRAPQHTITTDVAQQKDVSSRYDYTAQSFDADIGLSELLMGVNRLRKRLARQCTGNVLEVSCGTGRNLGYYDLSRSGKVESLTFVDLSPGMIEICRKKWDIFVGKNQKRLREGLSVRFLTGNALQPMPLAPAARKYDTIIQTMGLCSTPSPVALLTNMAHYLDTDNPDARILLLEHGRSYYKWLNDRILDPSAQRHAEEHGCWWNRDIGALVEEVAEKSGLEVVRERRSHFGTTWLFELKPKPGWTPPILDAQTKEGEQADGKKGWTSWIGWIGTQPKDHASEKP